MNSRHIKYFRPQTLVIFLVTLGLLFAGVRVPDISRHHRPKPTHRVVLENHHKNYPNHLKACGDVVAVIAAPPVFGARVSHRAAPPIVLPRCASLSFFPNSGRSPPDALG
jgi:hypothetical protein